MRVLLTGAKGQLGRCIIDRAINYQITVLPLTSDQLDISQMDQVREVLLRVKPDAIINAAAYTAVDKAEENSERAYQVNGDGPKNLALLAAELTIPLVHISTDYVFEGTATEPYTPDSPVNPLSVYGKSKLQGEQAVLASDAQVVIIRTAWVFSEYGNNFVKTIIRLANQYEQLSIIADQYGCPTYAGDLADACLKSLHQAQQGDFIPGVYHYTGDYSTSWHGFATAIVDEAYQQGLIPKRVNVKAITTEDYPVPAPRPSYSVMDCSLYENHYGFTRSVWRYKLKQVLSSVMNE